MPHRQGILLRLLLLPELFRTELIGSFFTRAGDRNLYSLLLCGLACTPLPISNRHKLRAGQRVLITWYRHRVCNSIIEIVQRNLHLVHIPQEAFDLLDLPIHALDFLVAEFCFRGLLVVYEGVAAAVAEEEAGFIELECYGVQQREALRTVRAHITFGFGAVVDGAADELGELIDAVLYPVDGAAEFYVVVRSIDWSLLPILLLGARVSTSPTSAVSLKCTPP